MEIRVFVRGVDDPTSLRALAEDRVKSALDRHAERVRAVTVRMEDETGPGRHRVDKVCAIDVQLDRGDVRIREVGEQFPAALEVALDRLRTSLSRQISRSKRGVGEG